MDFFQFIILCFGLGCLAGKITNEIRQCGDRIVAAIEAKGSPVVPPSGDQP
jgi:hypothetical protein